jgi:hypothetical protein
MEGFKASVLQGCPQLFVVKLKVHREVQGEVNQLLMVQVWDCLAKSFNLYFNWQVSLLKDYS